jgi:hypothetical protein
LIPQRLLASRSLSLSSGEAGRTAKDLAIFVDGGIREHTISALATAGADGVISDSLVFAAPELRAAVGHLHRPQLKPRASAGANSSERTPMPTPVLRADALITSFDGALTATHGDRRP